MSQELSETVEELSHSEGPVQHHHLVVVGRQLRQDLKDALNKHTPQTYMAHPVYKGDDFSTNKTPPPQ